MGIQPQPLGGDPITDQVTSAFDLLAEAVLEILVQTNDFEKLEEDDFGKGESKSLGLEDRQARIGEIREAVKTAIARGEVLRELVTEGDGAVPAEQQEALTGLIDDGLIDSQRIQAMAAARNDWDHFDALAAPLVSLLESMTTSVVAYEEEVAALLPSGKDPAETVDEDAGEL